ncbi:MAG TPA: hypothetical protein VMV92_01945 [Streptosporangiaceae bacterium]|nr:hypothetical protein [Streptosporangiaceae bacterium]
MRADGGGERGRSLACWVMSRRRSGRSRQGVRVPAESRRSAQNPSVQRDRAGQVRHWPV